jgi:hypothetical protein
MLHETLHPFDFAKMALINDTWSPGVMNAGLDILAPLTPQFFVPQMVNKPQDPIVHAIEEKAVRHNIRDLTYPRDATYAQKIPALPTLSPEMLWAKSVISGHQHSVRTLRVVVRNIGNSLMKHRIESYLGTSCTSHTLIVHPMHS